MDHAFCPGAKLLRQPKPEMFPCPSCGEEVEIWSDEFRGTCLNCGKAMFRDGMMSCLDWCSYGKDCVGDQVYQKYLRNKAMGVKQKLLEVLAEYFGADQERIDHAKQVLLFAEQLAQQQAVDWHIVLSASILHDVGIKVALEKYGSAAALYQEREGPPVARKMLQKAALKREDVEQICDIIGHHHSPGREESANFKVVYDADCLVNLAPKCQDRTDREIKQLIEESFLTPYGKKLALERYLKGGDKS